jgi:hypothetical protein
VLVDVTKVLPALEVLQNAKHKFTLTGSRYIGGHRPKSDWDFVAEDSRSVRAFLSKNGFEDLKDKAVTSDMDGHTSTIYQSGRIQVQLSKNVEAKLFARNLIKQHFKKQHLAMPQTARRVFWGKLCDSYVYGSDPSWRKLKRQQADGSY